MTDTVTNATAANSGANAPLEKIPLETYVPPAKPSLIGLSRAEIADRLGEIGIAPAPELASAAVVMVSVMGHQIGLPASAGKAGNASVSI